MKEHVPEGLAFLIVTGMGVIEKKDLLSKWKVSYRVIYDQIPDEQESISRFNTHVIWALLYTIRDRPIEMFDCAPPFLCQKSRSSGYGQV